MLSSILSSLTFVLAVIALWGAVEGYLKYAEVRRLRDPQSEHLAEAAVTTKLVPRISPFIKDGSILRVVGSDGSYAQGTRGEVWIASLQEWMNRGCSICYILTDPHCGSVAAFKALQARSGGRFDLVLLDASCARTSQIDAIAAEFETRHPVLLENADGSRVLWIENFHPKNSEIAFDIDFVAPRDAENDGRFDEYRKKIDAVAEACGVTEPERRRALAQTVAA